MRALSNPAQDAISLVMLFRWAQKRIIRNTSYHTSVVARVDGNVVLNLNVSLSSFMCRVFFCFPWSVVFCLPLSLVLSAIGKVSFAYWGSALALAIAAELVSVQRRKRLQIEPNGYRAGDLGLDPFGLADDEVSRSPSFPQVADSSRDFMLP